LGEELKLTRDRSSCLLKAVLSTHSQKYGDVHHGFLSRRERLGEGIRSSTQAHLKYQVDLLLP